MEQMDYNLLFRWFVGLGIDDPVCVPTVFTKNRDRLLTTDMSRKVMAAILAHPEVKPLLSGEHFSVDGTLVKAWASMKTIGLATVEIAMLHWQGLTDLTYEDYDIIALVNQDAAGLMVPVDSFASAEELLEAIKNEPAGTYKGSGTAQGGIWHVALAGWLLDEGLEPDHVAWVPSRGLRSSDHRSGGRRCRSGDLTVVRGQGDDRGGKGIGAGDHG
jgi:hypothetical protein